jgi:radical SAM superfamily enzyme YgiQ (UPF0313 family)
LRAPFILLINPWIHDFAAYDLWVRPLGLLYIAAVLRKNGFGIHLIDCLNIHPYAVEGRGTSKLPSRKKTGQGHFSKQEIPKPEILKDIRKKFRRYGVMPSFFDGVLSAIPRPDAVIVTSMMTYWYTGVFEVIGRVRSFYPEVPIFLGGVYATLCPEHAKRFSGADFVLGGQSEGKLIKLLGDLTGKDSLWIPDFSDLDTLPYPAHDLRSSTNSLPILSAKGCPFRCTYCASSLLHPHLSQRDPLRVSAEIEYWIQQTGTSDFIFYDDALLVNAENHLKPMLNNIIKRKLSVRFHLPNGIHIRGLTQEIADLMMESNFKTLRLGLETADANLQKNTGGKASVREFRDAAKVLKKAGFSANEVGVYILAGLPGQASTDVRKTVELVKEQGFRPLIAEYSPIPGTQLWKDAIAQSPFPIMEEPLFQNNTLLPCQSEEFTLKDLQILKKESREGL